MPSMNMAAKLANARAFFADYAVPAREKAAKANAQRQAGRDEEAQIKAKAAAKAK